MILKRYERSNYFDQVRRLIRIVSTFDNIIYSPLVINIGIIIKGHLGLYIAQLFLSLCFLLTSSLYVIKLQPIESLNLNVHMF